MVVTELTAEKYALSVFDLSIAGLVRIEAHGRERTCHPELLRLKVVYDWVRIYEQFWTEKLDRLGEHLDRRRSESQIG